MRLYGMSIFQFFVLAHTDSPHIIILNIDDKGCSRCLVIKFKSACFLTPMTADIKFQRLKRETTDVE